MWLSVELCLETISLPAMVCLDGPKAELKQVSTPLTNSSQHLLTQDSPTKLSCSLIQ